MVYTGNERRNDSDSNPAQIKVVIVDDHVMVAEGLAAIIRHQPDLVVVGIAATAVTGIDTIAKTSPDVVIMDYGLPDEDGAAATVAIKHRWPEISVIMLTGAGTEEALAKAIEAGCSGFLVKALSGPTVPEAIRAVWRGELVIHSDALHSALGHLRAESVDKHRLTTRELEVLRMIATGIGTDDAAAKLFISSNTMRNHVQNVLMKLGAHSKLEAVAIGLRDGLVAIHHS